MGVSFCIHVPSPLGVVPAGQEIGVLVMLIGTLVMGVLTYEVVDVYVGVSVMIQVPSELGVVPDGQEAGVLTTGAAGSIVGAGSAGAAGA